MPWHTHYSLRWELKYTVPQGATENVLPITSTMSALVLKLSSFPNLTSPGRLFSLFLGTVLSTWAGLDNCCGFIGTNTCYFNGMVHLIYKSHQRAVLLCRKYNDAIVFGQIFFVNVKLDLNIKKKISMRSQKSCLTIQKRWKTVN